MEKQDITKIMLKLAEFRLDPVMVGDGVRDLFLLGTSNSAHILCGGEFSTKEKVMNACNAAFDFSPLIELEANCYLIEHAIGDFYVYWDSPSCDFSVEDVVGNWFTASVNHVVFTPNKKSPYFNNNNPRSVNDCDVFSKQIYPASIEFDPCEFAIAASAVRQKQDIVEISGLAPMSLDRLKDKDCVFSDLLCIFNLIPQRRELALEFLNDAGYFEYLFPCCQMDERDVSTAISALSYLHTSLDSQEVMAIFISGLATALAKKSATNPKELADAMLKDIDVWGKVKDVVDFIFTRNTSPYPPDFNGESELRLLMEMTKDYFLCYMSYLFLCDFIKGEGSKDFQKLDTVVTALAATRLDDANNFLTPNLYTQITGKTASKEVIALLSSNLLTLCLFDSSTTLPTLRGDSLVKYLESPPE